MALSDGSGVLVSIHLTSNRPGNVVRLFDNLEATAADPTNVEVCIKIDDFDRPMNELMAREAARRPFRIRYISTPLPGGFWGLWTALNDLVAACDPNAYFLVNFNDEMSFQEPGWDLALKRYVGFFPDHIFRLRTSRFRLRNYRDWWECGFAPETSAFTTKRWIDIQGNWNACIGPDTFQQTVAFWLSRANWPGQHQYNRDVPIHDIKIGGEGAGLGMTEDQWRRWSRAAVRNWRHIMSHPIQSEANRRARLIQAHLFASERGLEHVEVRDNDRGAVELIDTRAAPRSPPLARFPYRLSRLRIGLTNWWRGFHYYYYGGGGPDVRRQWRHHQFTYLGLRYAFLLEPFRWIARKWTGLRFTPNLCDGGLPFASGHDATPAFVPDTQSWWTSPERGMNVKGRAHIGYFFAEPVHIRRIVLVQTTNHPFRQDRVRVERSPDGGQTWRRVHLWQGRLRGSRSVLHLWPSGPAQSWRLVAAADNATTDLHAWTPIHIEMQAAHSWVDTFRRMVSAELRRGTAQQPSALAAAIASAPSDGDVAAEAVARFDPEAMNALLAGPQPMRLVEAAEAAIARRPDDPLPHLLEGHAYCRLGRRDLARIAYQRALDRAPEDGDALLSLAALIRADEGGDAARRWIERLTVEPAAYTVTDRDPVRIAACIARYGCAVIKGALDPELAIRLHRDALRGIYAQNDRARRAPEERWRGVYPFALLSRSSTAMTPDRFEPEPSPLERVMAPLRGATARVLGPGREAPAAEACEIAVDCADPLSPIVRYTQHNYAAPARKAALVAWIPLVRAGEEAPGRAPVPVPLRHRFPVDALTVPPELAPDLRLVPGDALLQTGTSLARSWSNSEMIAPLVAVIVRWG